MCSQTRLPEEEAFDLSLEDKRDSLHLISSLPRDLSPSAIILFTFPPAALQFCNTSSELPALLQSLPRHLQNKTSLHPRILWSPVQGSLSFSDLSICPPIHYIHPAATSLTFGRFQLHRHKCSRIFHLKTYFLHLRLPHCL